ncbi:hypothetical protein SAMN05421747_10452 [Parapedobacter composti]|uniref:Uncharacterized protein n=1 Tax=Parapedobacter composti TaxID=623281 RepID=A0A1I1GA02_9SPHI|nr:hypothetical protein [Parapedobacter composti]SFC08226.1 hypothetical protein SAMN05421747_10452 [Parapedobacter composti]
MEALEHAGFKRLLILCLLLGYGCRPTGTSGDAGTAATRPANDDTVSASTGISPLADTVCYQHIHGRDTITLRLHVQADSVSGTLRFNNYQIDDSHGTVAGRFRSDTLVVLYDFHAEGMHSTQEEIFFREGRRLVRSTGQVFNPAACN